MPYNQGVSWDETARAYAAGSFERFLERVRAEVPEDRRGALAAAFEMHSLEVSMMDRGWARACLDVASVLRYGRRIAGE